MGKVSKNYISEIGEFLKEYDQKPEATSDSRKQEEEKYKRVHSLRDNIQADNDKSEIWEDF